jgi:hypothetical protein
MGAPAVHGKVIIKARCPPVTHIRADALGRFAHWKSAFVRRPPHMDTKRDVIDIDSCRHLSIERSVGKQFFVFDGVS